LAESTRKPTLTNQLRSGAKSAVRSIASSSLFLRKQIWIWPILAALLLAIVGFWMSRSVEDAMRLRRESELTTILDADVAALRIWRTEQVKDAELIASDEQIRRTVRTLLEAVEANNAERSLLQSPAQEAVRARLKSSLAVCGFHGFLIVSRQSVVLAADLDAPVGKVLPGYQKGFFAAVARGTPSVSRPFRSVLLLKDERGDLRANLPTMFTAAPLRDEKGQVIAVLALRNLPDADFTRILHVARNGATGETYAFNEDGLMISESRFDDQLKQIGLLADLPDSRSILTLELRDPEVDMTVGERPAKRRADQPLTRMAMAAVGGSSGVDVTGYRDYRGVPVIGAWSWLKDEGYGIATKQDVAEAFQPLYVLRRAIWGLFGLLVAASVAIFLFTIAVARANREARRAALEAKHLGQYTLDEKLGEGGMGVVYRAHHDMLQRPTAVKFLSPEKTNEQTLARFEREVQLTSRLSHPNTIAIYDYGRTPENIFYYAMEFLDGVDLENLVGKFGPQPEGRSIFILQQVCGSLAEAHAVGLIHRDIKPANVILTDRGGIYDFVKLLDFGLVKALDSRKDASLTSADSLTGTPLYLPPEAIKHEGVDARSDLYSLGALGYFLLTGSPVFDGDDVYRILQQHVSEAPIPPSTRLGKPVSADFESLLLACLAKSPADRPANAAALYDQLAKCAIANPWTQQDAREWWRRYRQRSTGESIELEPAKDSMAATQNFSPAETISAKRV
jgi:serine/threonine protein kinase